MEHKDKLVSIGQTISLVDGDILRADPIDLTIEQFEISRNILRDTEWVNISFEIDGDPVIVPRERVNFIRLHVL